MRWATRADIPIASENYPAHLGHSMQMQYRHRLTQMNPARLRRKSEIQMTNDQISGVEPAKDVVNKTTSSVGLTRPWLNNSYSRPSILRFFATKTRDWCVLER
ncbi:MAG TPA: hypothetical protein VFE47_06090 [Tepidisphaeraceae bacterium]|jgi:hypothetical protein|nr:hypothetical protein [Tepidisphaeraceae bacterium]